MADLTKQQLADIVAFCRNMPPDTRDQDGTAQTIVQLTDQLDTAVKAYDELTNQRAEDYVNATTGLRGMKIRDRQAVMDIEAAHELIVQWCLAVRTVLDHHGAENYTETEITMPAPGVSMDVQDGSNPQDSYTLTLQRRYRPTAHELRQRAEAERDLDRLQRRVATMRLTFASTRRAINPIAHTPERVAAYLTRRGWQLTYRYAHSNATAWALDDTELADHYQTGEVQILADIAAAKENRHA